MVSKSVLDIATKTIKSVSRKDSVRTAAMMMIEQNLRNVLVVDEGNSEYGIITVADITDFIAAGVDFDQQIEQIRYTVVTHIAADCTALEASFLIRNEEVAYLCVVDKHDSLLGIVSMTDIMSSIDTEMVASDIKLGHIIGKTRAKTVRPSDPLRLAFVKVNETPTEAVVVADEHHIPLGIITKRDMVKLIIDHIDMNCDTKTYMSAPLVCVTGETTVKEALQMMSSRHFKRLIVVERNGELMGIITREEMIDIVYNKWSQVVRDKEVELRKLSKTLERTTQESEKNIRLLSDLLDATDDFVFYKGLDFRYLGCNRAFADFAKTTKEQIIGKSDFELFDDYYAHLFRQTDEDVIRTATTIEHNYWTEYKEHKAFFLSVKKSPLMDNLGNIIGLIGISRDITEQKNMEDTVKEQHTYLQTILDMQESMLAITPDGVTLLEANKRFFDFFGVRNLSEFCEKNIRISDLFVKKGGYLSGNKNETWFRQLTAVSSGDGIDFKVLMHPAHAAKNNEEVQKSFLVKADKFKKGAAYLLSFTDITNIEKESQTFEIMAMTDPLTKIYNRMKFGNLMEAELTKTRRNKKNLSLVIMDIDFFKKINDNFGHQTGDYILVTVVELIKSKIRDSDIFARWGGEEFMILLPGATKEVALMRAESFRGALSEYDFIEPSHVTASFGVAVYHEGDSIDTMVKRADESLYQAKRNGRDRVETID